MYWESTSSDPKKIEILRDGKMVSGILECKDTDLINCNVSLGHKKFEFKYLGMFARKIVINNLTNNQQMGMLEFNFTNRKGVLRTTQEGKRYHWLSEGWFRRHNYYWFDENGKEVITLTPEPTETYIKKGGITVKQHSEIENLLVSLGVYIIMLSDKYSPSLGAF